MLKGLKRRKIVCLIQTTNMSQKKIKNALISVFHKDNLEPIINRLNELGITMYSTGGTQKFIEDLGAPVTAVESFNFLPFNIRRKSENFASKSFWWYFK